ncbi:MAG: hypothetical protein ACSLEW_14515 [Nocardioides sp.]
MSWASAIGPVQDLEHAAADLGAGNWLGGSIRGMEASLDVLAIIDDPFGPLISAGISWVLDHLEPFPTWLDDLCGDPHAVRDLVTRWHDISSVIDANAAGVRRIRDDTLDGWAGLSATAFASAAAGTLAAIAVCGRATAAVASAVELAGSVVAGVRAFVRDTIADLVGFAVSKSVELLSIVLSGHAIASIARKVANTASSVRRFLADLSDSARRLSELLTRVRELCVQVHRNLDGLVSGLGGHLALDGADFLSH